MAKIIKVKELRHKTTEDSEYPVSVMRTTKIVKVPDDFDYGSMCDDRTDVEVIAGYVPDDALMEVWDLPKQLPAIKDEGELSDIILENFQLLTCFNCGEKLGDVKSNYRAGSEEAGVLCIEPGSINYPREPDEPAAVYFECVECRNNRKESIGGQNNGSKR
jgi:hypothetical protein